MKYRSSERSSVIDISTSEDHAFYYLSVKDNGLGINIAQHQQNLFKLYKRFHFHTEGKGIGLYLVKLQSEALGGSVEVSSEINRYTTFTVKIKKPKNIERQLLFQNERVDVFYDGRLNSLILVWLECVTGKEYREVYQTCLEFIRVYNTPNFIADMRKQGVVSEEEQEWFFKEILPEAKPNGIFKIATILPGGALDIRMDTYLNEMKSKFEKYHIDHQFFLTFESATDWIQSENEIAALKIRNSNGSIA